MMNSTNMIFQKGVYFQVTSRDKKKLDTYVLKPKNNIPELLISEETNTYHDIYNTKSIRLINNETEIIYWSERDGWGHLYRYSSNGKLINRITRGPFVENSLDFNKNKM